MTNVARGSFALVSKKSVDSKLTPEAAKSLSQEELQRLLRAAGYDGDLKKVPAPVELPPQTNTEAPRFRELSEEEVNALPIMDQLAYMKELNVYLKERASQVGRPQLVHRVKITDPKPADKNGKGGTEGGQINIGAFTMGKYGITFYAEQLIEILSGRDTFLQLILDNQDRLSWKKDDQGNIIAERRDAALAKAREMLAGKQ